MKWDSYVNALNMRMERLIPGYSPKELHGTPYYILKNEEGYKELAFDIGKSFQRFRINAIVSSISFQKVEHILSPILEKYEIEYSGSNNYTVQQVLSDISNVDYSFRDFYAESEKDLDQVFYEIDKVIRFGALPFFAQNDTLDKVADNLAYLTPKEILKFIFGPTLFIKSIAILRLASHPRYELRKIEFLGILQKKALEDKRYYIHLKSLEEFIQMDI